MTTTAHYLLSNFAGWEYPSLFVKRKTYAKKLGYSWKKDTKRNTIRKCLGCGHMSNHAKQPDWRGGCRRCASRGLWGGCKRGCADCDKFYKESCPESEVAYIYYKVETPQHLWETPLGKIANVVVYVNPELLGNEEDTKTLWKKLRPVNKLNVKVWESEIWSHLIRQYTTEIKIPRVFARKIAEKWLEAKYNPRTVIGEKYHDKLYNETFDEDNLEVFSSDGETEEEKKHRLDFVNKYLEEKAPLSADCGPPPQSKELIKRLKELEEEEKESYTIYGVGTVEIQ